MPLPMTVPQRKPSSLEKSRAAVLDGVDGRHQRELREAVQSARTLGVDLRLGGPVFDLAGEVNPKGRRVELFDRADAALAGAKAVPELLQVDCQRVDRAHPCDDDAPRHFLPSSFSM